MKSHARAFVLRGSLMLLGWFGATVAMGADAPQATRVVIESDWGGLSPDMPLLTHIAIERRGDTYELSGGQSKHHLGKPQPEQPFPLQAIPAAAIQRLVAAMQAPPQSQIDLTVLRPAVDKVQAQIDQMFTEIDLPDPPPMFHEKMAAWRETLRSPDTLSKALTKGFGARYSDDYPFIKVDVTLSDGSMLSARSGSQQYLMLPWKRAGSGPTYSAELSGAIDALLPAEATNKERLEGPISPDSLDVLLDFGLESDASRLLAEAGAPDALRLLESRFEVKDVEVVNWHGRHIAATLKLPGGPANLTLATRLLLSQTALADSHEVDRIQQQLTLAQTSPGMAAQMQAKPNTDFLIQDNFGWAWLNKKTVDQFVQQMRAMRKLPELKTDPSLMQGAVMITEGQSPVYWIVLSDGRAVRWKEYASSKDIKKSERCEGILHDDDDPPSLPITDRCLGDVYEIDTGIKSH
ncbi:hypothetical protein [Dyella sp. GSA-30]|uniref:hypothetical protein n=1 Tax=Dyella sp. GSA-30 TaxID=2994496 RepID=UPI00248FC3A6|nr:hypothetical protein [Dyella sp. GSA-30]